MDKRKRRKIISTSAPVSTIPTPLTFAETFVLYVKAQEEISGWYMITIKRLRSADEITTQEALLAEASKSRKMWSALLDAVYRSDFSQHVLEEYRRQ